MLTPSLSIVACGGLHVYRLTYPSDAFCLPTLCAKKGVYHCTDPVPTEPDWGIALRVSKEAEGGGGSGGGKSVPDSSTAKRKREGKQESSSLPVDAEAAGELEEVITPPLLVPLQSGDAYFLLDDFK